MVNERHMENVKKMKENDNKCVYIHENITDINSNESETH